MRRSIPILSLPIVLLVLSAGVLPAQESRTTSILLGVGYSRGTAIADFGDTGRYRDVSDGDIVTESGSVGVMIPIGESGRFDLIARVSYRGTTAEFVYDRREYLVMDWDNSIVPVTDEQRLDYTISDTGLDLLLCYRPVAGVGITAGLNTAKRSVGKWQLATRYDYLEHPNPVGRPSVGGENIIVVDDRRRLDFNPVSIALLGSVNYFLPVSPLIDLVPAITARYDLLSPVEGATLRTLSFGGEISLKFGL